MRPVRRLVTACCLLAAIAGCASHNQAGTAGAAPTTLRPDGLLLSVEDVSRITHFGDLSSDPNLDVRTPGTLDAQAPEPCRVIFDQQAAFGQGWTGFRSVWYSGAANKGVTQAVVVYPEPAGARNALGRITSALAACSALHAAGYDITTRAPTPSTVEVCFDTCRVLYRQQASVLIDVSVQRFSDAERIAGEVAQAIADRVNGA